MTNSWWEFQIICEPELEDLIFWRLDKFGSKGMSSQHQGRFCSISTYLPSLQVQLLDLAALSLWMRQDALEMNLPVPAIRWHLIDEEDWSSSWKQYWQPQEIADCILICPAWLNPPDTSDRIIVYLDPGAAFGTGTHQTTQLCLESLEMRLGPIPSSFLGEENRPDELVIADIGCGSGILSLAAVLLGAGKVCAVDIDPLAVRSARENRRLNKIPTEKLLVEEGSADKILELAGGMVEGIVCHILAEVIIDLIPHIEEISKPNTWGIISGVLLEQAKPIADTLEQHGWIVSTLWKREEWCCFNIRRS